jgi:hypothetical protein
MTSPFDESTQSAIAKLLAEVAAKNPPPVPVIYGPEQEYNKSVTLLLYGGSKTGKTHLAGSAGPRTLYIDLDDSSETFSSPTFKQANPAGGPNFIVRVHEKLDDNGLTTKPEAYDKVCDTIDWFLKKMNDQFDTVVVDGTTMLKRFAMFKGLKISGELGKSQSQANSQKHDMLVVGVQDFGAEMSLMEQFIAGYMDILGRCGKHFIVIAHERVTYNKPQKIGDPPTVEKIRPGFTGQTFPDQIIGYFDWIFRTETAALSNGIGFRLRTRGNDSIVAGGRSAGVFNDIEIPAPSFPQLIERAHKGQFAIPPTINRGGRK